MENLFILLLILFLFTFTIFSLFQRKKITKKKKKKNTRKEHQPISKPNAYFDYSYMPYQRNNLLTKTEYKFYLVLKQKCDEQHLLICPKVRLEDFISVPVEDFKEKQKYRGHIKSRHVDFLLTDNDLHILAGIELDDSTHNTEQAMIIDEFKDNLFATIGIPLFRIKTNAKYTTSIDSVLKKLKCT